MVLGPVGLRRPAGPLLHPVLLPVWLAGLAWLFRSAGGPLPLPRLDVRRLLRAALRRSRGRTTTSPRSTRCSSRPGQSPSPRASSGGRHGPAAPGRRRRASRVIVAGRAHHRAAALPLLSPERYSPTRRRSVSRRRRPRWRIVARCRSIFGDQFGWPELVAEVARIYHGAAGRRSARVPHLRQQLRRGRRHQPLRAALRAAAGRERPPDAISSGGRAAQPARCCIVAAGRPRGLEACAPRSRRPGVHFHPWGWRRRTTRSTSAAASSHRSPNLAAAEALELRALAQSFRSASRPRAPRRRGRLAKPRPVPATTGARPGRTRGYPAGRGPARSADREGSP